jgi:hypothetical protein
MWFHRRFKTRPEGEAMPYPKKPRHLKEELEIAKAAAKAKEKANP